MKQILTETVRIYKIGRSGVRFWSLYSKGKLGNIVARMTWIFGLLILLVPLVLLLLFFLLHKQQILLF